MPFNDLPFSVTHHQIYEPTGNVPISNLGVRESGHRDRQFGSTDPEFCRIEQCQRRFGVLNLAVLDERHGG